MSMRRGVVAVILVALVAGGIVWWRGRGGGGDSASDAAASATAAEQVRNKRKRVTLGSAASAPGAIEPVVDADPRGTMRLEGQVVTADMAPVGGAEVTLSTNPRRTIKTEADGSFAFDGLLQRPYQLLATHADQFAGPVGVTVTAQTEPVVLVLQPGTAVDVLVVSADDRAPVGGATVELRSWVTRRATTDAAGRARIAGVPVDYYDVVAWAPGYGRAHSWFFMPEGATAHTETIELRAGAAVGGVVVDAAGAPVADARVLYKSTNAWSVSADERYDAVVTGADGRFRVPALPAGTYWFNAHHAELAPGSSRPVTLDGVNERTDVEVRMAPGGVIAGHVVDASGKPVPSAAVRVAGTGRNRWSRQVFADDGGAFELRALPRRELVLGALHDDAASPQVTVNLTDTAEMRDLTVTLSVTGRIAGVVVDSAGEPVEGAQVWAVPQRPGDNWWAVRGLQRELTDAGGRFELRGLDDGRYVLRANPPAVVAKGFAWMRNETTAAVGDTDVRIELEATGGIEGVVAFEDGTAPEAFTVRIGPDWMPPRPFANDDGAFSIADLPPGVYPLLVRGVGFEPVQRDKVKVSAGGVTDLGTIAVRKGKVLSGRVVDGQGRPVLGAEVTAAHILIGSGLEADSGRFGPQVGAGARTALTDAQGAFSLYGVGRGNLIVIAAHERLGRSSPMRLPKSNESVAGLTLKLAGYGAIEGNVVGTDGNPIDSVNIVVQSQTAPWSVMMVRSGTDGSYRLDRLAPDTYTVNAAPGSPFAGLQLHGKSAVVRSDETTRVDLTMAAGDVAVEVAIATTDGGTVTSAMVFLVDGDKVARLADATALYEAAARRPSGYWALAMSARGIPAIIPKVVPGRYTACAVAYPDEVSGFNRMMDYMITQGEHLNMACKAFDVTDAPDRQSVAITVDVPPMAPPLGDQEDG